MKKAAFFAVISAFFPGALRASAPTAVNFTGVSTGTASVSWTLDTPGTEFPLMVLSADPSFSVPVSSAVLALGQNATTYYGLLSNATYYFKVKVSTESDAAWSAVVSSATPPSAPQAVTLLAVDVSSFSALWPAGNNAGGSVYWAEASLDDSFSINAISSGTAALALYEGLNPNSTYFLRVRTLGVGGQDSGYSAYGATITRVYPPGSEAYPAVAAATLSLVWDDNGNPSGTRYELVVSTSPGFSTVNYSTLTAGNYYDAAGLRPNTTHYFKAAAVSWGGVYSEFVVFGDTLTYSAVPADNPPGLGVPDATSVPAQWLANGNPNITEYYVQASTAADFLGFDAGPKVWFTGPVRTVSGLESGRLYYFRVKARDQQGRSSAWFDLGSKSTLTGADNTPPSVIPLQAGDDTWRGSASGSYMVHFSDLGSLLDKFQVAVSTGKNFTGAVVSTWTPAVTGINSDTYDTDWVLPAPVFEAIQENVTSYVSVRVYDNAGNSTVYPDAFYVRRDTTPPTIANYASSPAGWLAADPGAVFDVDFGDALSGLGQVLYSASSNPGLSDANILSWTAVPGFAPAPSSFTALWGVDFAALRDGATNYISARAVDAAGNAVTLADVFKLLKNTVGPAVTITSPAGAWLSTVTAFTGTAAAMNEASPVAGNQLAIQELAGNLYYDGSSFASAAEVWLGASGLSSWSYDASTAPFAAGTQYKVKARSVDVNSFLTPLPYPNASFRLDQAAPSVFLSTPLAGSTVYALTEIEGTAADTGGAGLGTIELYVKRAADGKWWNFASDTWGELPVASAAVTGAAWAFVPGTGLRGGLAHNQQYFITALSKDAAAPANSSVFEAAGSTFTWADTVPPEAVAAFAPSTGSAPGRVDLAWTFPGDDGGSLALTYGQFAVQYSTFAGAVFSTQAAQVLISTAMVRPGSALAYTVAGLVPEATYYFTMWVKDDADFWSGPSALANTLSGDRLDDMIAGSVKTPNGTGITGVMVDAISNQGLVIASAYTLDDGLGSFALTSLPDGLYRIQATWLEDGFSSSIAKDQLPMGYSDANFVLSLDYQLASVSGTLPASVPSGLRPSAAGGAAQLLRGTRLVASASPDPAGRFIIRNLLPGPYTLRVRGEDGAWRSFDLKLAPGQNLEIKPLGQLLIKGAVYA
ncbi:MAG: hypothetical protein HY550_08900, partial [Elusimicrobia bacterium]|nr:hypothetical protein [Elusimicrobiota bacterium]